MRYWWINILLFLAFAFAFFKIQQFNVVKTRELSYFLSGNTADTFKSEIDTIGYNDVLHLIYSSFDLNTHFKLNIKDQTYTFHYDYYLDKNSSWDIVLQQDGDTFVLKKTTSIEAFKKIVNCKEITIDK